MSPRPKILLRAGLDDGPSVVAAAHASLAWQLRSARLGFGSAMALPFAPGEVRHAPVDELEANAVGPHLRMTESSLGDQMVAVVRGSDDDGILARPHELEHVRVDPLQAMHLRMYLLLLPGQIVEQVAHAATASVQCFLQFRDDPCMRQWAAGVFVKTVCRVRESELQRALQEPGASPLLEPGSGRLRGAAFCPRPSFARCFRFFPLYR